ncbi:MAG: leucine-rich repeat domain-containing protein [Clostridia bacterium]|nr:leucine-rich repeat domain-containing protein [Clostridia bacterium]
MKMNIKKIAAFGVAACCLFSTTACGKKECFHTYTSDVTKEATCKEFGVTTYTCGLCGDSYTEDIAKIEKHIIEFGTCVICGEFFPTEGIVYSVSEDNTYAEVIGYSGDDVAEMVIAPTYKGLPVERIADRAFTSSWATHVKNFHRVFIPDTVKVIGDCAFMYCTMKEVRLGKNVREIGRLAFYCRNLTKINLPESLTLIGESAFEDCKLSNIDIPSGVKIEEAAFVNCELIHVTMGKDCILSDFIFNVNHELTEINFQGTKKEWELMNKSYSWNKDGRIASSFYSAPKNLRQIICIDGIITL